MTSKDTNPKDAIGTKKWRQFMVVPRQVVWEVGVGMLEGALKYGRHNYRAAGVRASVYTDAAIGHIDTWIEGEDIDKDSGLSHITKAICSLVVLRDAMMNDFFVDDRPPKIKDMDALRYRLQTLVEDNFDRHADKNPHHYTDIEDEPPYRDADEFRGVHMDPTERKVMQRLIDNGEWQNWVNQQREEDLKKAEPWARAIADEHAKMEQFLGSMQDVRDDAGRVINPDIETDGSEHVRKGSRVEGILPAEMKVGGVYRVCETWWGESIAEGAEWRIVRIDAATGDVFGVKANWSHEHPGVRLAASTKFEILSEPSNDFDEVTGLGHWNAADSDLEDNAILAVSMGAQDAWLQQKQRLLDHAQASASPTPPTCGLSAHAVKLISDWRTEEDGAAFAVNVPPVARALACRQWAVSKGLVIE